MSIENREEGYATQLRNLDTGKRLSGSAFRGKLGAFREQYEKELYPEAKTQTISLFRSMTIR